MIFILLAIIILVVSFVLAFVSLVREQSKFERETDFQKEGEIAQMPKAEVQIHEEESQPVVVSGVQNPAVDGEVPYKLKREVIQDLQQPYGVARIEDPLPWLKGRQQEPDLPQDSEEKRTIDLIRQEIAKKVEENKIKQSQDETEYASDGRLRGEFSLTEHRET